MKSEDIAGTRRRSRFALARSVGEYLLLTVAWLGAAVAAFALARAIEADAAGGDHNWLFGDFWLFISGIVPASAAVFLWWLSHSLRAAALGARLRRWLAGAPVAPTYQSLIEVVEPAEDYDLRSAVLLVVDTSRYSTRAVEKVAVGDAYNRHSVVREFTLPHDTDEGTNLEDVDDAASRLKEGASFLNRLPGERELGDDLGRLFSHVTRDRDDDEPRTFLLPLLRVLHGVVVDNLEVTMPGGQRISTLNANEYYGLMEYLIKALTLTLTGANELTEAQEDGIAELLSQAHSLTAATDTITSVDKDAPIRWLDEIEPPPRQRPDDAEKWAVAKERLIRLGKAVRGAYIIFVPIVRRAGERVVLEYTYTQPHRMWTLGARDRLRYFLGLRPHEHELTLLEHRWAQSYHFEFSAPLDQYVFDCSVRALSRTAGEPPGSVVSYPPQGVQGRDHVHIYVREADRAEYRDRAGLAVSVDCREKPPGMLGAVAMIALAEAVLIWVIGIRHNAYFGQLSDNQVNDLPALLLAAPGLVVGWLGSQFTGERLRSTSMATVVGLILCGLVAIASTALALLKTTGNSFAPWVALDVQHPWWLALMLVSAVLVVDLSLRAIVRGRRFGRTIRCGPELRTEFL